MSNSLPIIAKLAKLLAEQRLVPFFGAGVSRDHLGFAGVELAREMANLVEAPVSTPLSDVADIITDKLGHDTLLTILRQKLIVPELDDAKATAHLLLLSLSPSVLYTTNQDNIFELTAARYGRPYRRVVTLEDISQAVPGERLLYKYHGDLDVPHSLVFGTRSYQERIRQENHPLDIRLRSDLLGKQLLFLGYSFEDENVQKVIASIQRVFASDTMPPSYLVAFKYDPAMDNLARDFGIQIVDPLRLIPEAADPKTAFGRLLKLLCDATIERQAEQGFQNLFAIGDRINPRMVTQFEADAATVVIQEGRFESALNAFRGLFDESIAPIHLRNQMLVSFRGLIALADPDDDEHIAGLRAALFNLRLPPELALEATAALMAFGNRRAARPGFDDFVTIMSPALPDGSSPMAATMAVIMLLERNETITDNFRRLAVSWFAGYEDVDLQVRQSVREGVAHAWPENSTSPRPSPHNRLLAPGFHKIMADLEGILPKQRK